MLSARQMAKILAKKLSKEEFLDLFTLYDEQDTALYTALGDLAIKIAPERFDDESSFTPKE